MDFETRLILLCSIHLTFLTGEFAPESKIYR